MSQAPGVPRALEGLSEQPRVRDFLARAVREGRLSHAYLFLGAPGSGKGEAALALAQCAICANGGDASCDECIRIRHRTHPDVHWLEPGGVGGYLIQQMRDLLDDVPLAPVRGRSKVYIIQEAALLRDAAANALLRTIEEPPEGVMFILLARSAEAVLPTIVSRCQQVPFRVVPPDVALRDVEALSGADGSRARVALSVAGTPELAAELLASPARREVRRLAVQAVAGLARDDSWDVLQAAAEIVGAVRKPLDAYRKRQRDGLKEGEEFLERAGLKRLEEANRRELSQRERSGMIEALTAVESLLRDVLLRREGVVGSDSVVNADASDAIERIAASASTAGALRALGAVRQAMDDLSHNVSPQLVVEVMLLSIKEAL